MTSPGQSAVLSQDRASLWVGVDWGFEDTGPSLHLQHIFTRAPLGFWCSHQKGFDAGHFLMSSHSVWAGELGPARSTGTREDRRTLSPGLTAWTNSTWHSSSVEQTETTLDPPNSLGEGDITWALVIGPLNCSLTAVLYR